MRSAVFRVIRGFLSSELAPDKLPTEFRDSVLRARRAFKEAGFSKKLAAICDVAVVVVDVCRDGGGVRKESVINFVMVAEPFDDVVVYGIEPRNSLSHFFTESIAHQSQLSIGCQRIFAVIRSYWPRLSAKALSSKRLIYSIDHAPGSQPESFAENHPDSWPRQEPGDGRQLRPMQSDARNRVKRPGLNAAQTPSSAPAPDQIGTLAGADTLSVTATNQSTRSYAGGGRCV